MFFFFFFNDTATTEIYTLSLHVALPISRTPRTARIGNPTNFSTNAIGTSTPSPIRLLIAQRIAASRTARDTSDANTGDRKSTRLNSSHLVISYAVFCLKKKRKQH